VAQRCLTVASELSCVEQEARGGMSCRQRVLAAHGVEGGDAAGCRTGGA